MHTLSPAPTHTYKQGCNVSDLTLKRGGEGLTQSQLQKVTGLHQALPVINTVPELRVDGNELPAKEETILIRWDWDWGNFK